MNLNNKAIGLLVFGGMLACANVRTVAKPDRVVVESPQPSTEPEVRPVPPPDDPQGAAQLAEAQQLEARGERVASRRVLQRLVRQQPNTRQGHRARHRLAELALTRGNYARAEALTQQPIAPEVAPGLAFVGWSLRGRALEALERFELAAQAYGKASLASAGDPAKSQEATRRRARSRFMSGDPQKASELLAGGSRKVDDPEVIDTLQRLVLPALRSQAALERLYGRVPTSSPWSAWVALQLARSLLEQGKMRQAGEIAGVAMERGDPNVRREASEIGQEVAAWNTVKPQTIGILLPLSGRYQKLGQAALEAIQLALGSTSGIRLIVRDTRGEAEQAAKMARALILQEHVSAILGPIGEKESAAATTVGGHFGVPHVTLTRNHLAGKGGSTVFRLRLSRTELGQHLARHAVEQLGIRRVAILFPENTRGYRHMASFWDKFVELGGEVRAVHSYAPKTTKFNPVIQRLVGASKRRKPGRIDFQALFIPDRAFAVRRIVPYLKYWGVRLKTDPDAISTSKRSRVQLLGSEGWNHPDVIDPGEHLTDNAVFVAPFFNDGKHLKADLFVTAFKDRYAKSPLTFHAEVFDATTFLALAVGKMTGTNHDGRVQVLEALRGRKDFVGATGPMVIVDNNTMVRAPSIMTIDLDTLRKRGSLDEEKKWRAVRRQNSSTAK